MTSEDIKHQLIITSACAWFNVALLPQKPEGSLRRGAQDGHLDFHTAFELRARPEISPELNCVQTLQKSFGWYNKARFPGCITCKKIYAHVKDPVVHVRVGLWKEQNNPACNKSIYILYSFNRLKALTYVYIACKKKKKKKKKRESMEPKFRTSCIDIYVCACII